MDFNGRVELNYFKGFYGKDANEELRTKTEVKNIVRECCGDLTFERIDFFNMGETPNTFDAGSKVKLAILANTTSKDAAAKDKDVRSDGIIIGGKERKFKTFFKPAASESIVIKSEDGIVIAEYFPKKFQINVLFDLFEEFCEDMLDTVRYILSAVNKLIPDLIDADKKWNIEDNKTRLLVSFEQEVVQMKQEQTRRDRDTVRNYEEQIRSYKREMMQYDRKRIALMKAIEAAVQGDKNEMQTIAADFDLIINHKKITSLLINGSLVEVKTVPLIITSDKGHRYYGGEYTITIDMKNSDVIFKGGTPRSSYWTSYDPHPHVNGKTGHACLGNVAETIAELCAGFQIYALVMICIDFLEAANTSDAAGKNVIKWDAVSDDGEEEAPPAPPAPTYTCACCEDEFEEEELFTVYDGEEEDEEGNWHAIGEHLVCENCREENYYYSDDTGEYIHD